MPNNDLGTAEGTIRLRYDDRGSDKVALALTKMEKQFQAMNDRLGKIEKAFNDADKAMDKAASSLDKTSKSARGFSSDIFSAHKNVTAFARDIQSLYNDLNKLNDAFGRMKDFSKPFALGFKTIDQFARGLDSGRGRVTAFGTALKTAGVASAVFNKTVVQNLIGVKSAIAEMPRWSQNVYQFSGYIAKAGAATLLLNKFLDPGKISKYVNAFANTGPMRSFLLQNERLAVGFEKLGQTLERMPAKLDGSIRPLANFAVSARGLLSGFALVNSGLKDIIARFDWLAKIPAPIKYAFNTLLANALPAALAVLGKALTATSNLAAGLWDGIQTLAGGFLALPGLVATVGAAILPLGLAFVGLKKQLKDVFSDDPAKAAQAYYALPAAIRPVIDSIQQFTDRFKAMQNTLQGIAFSGMEKQITDLGNVYFPLLERGSGNVILSFRKLKDQVVDFMLSAQTIKDVNRLYMTTSEVISNISTAIRPALEGLRNIGSVGADFIARLSGGLPGLTEKFAQFAQVNRDNGRLMMWMTNGYEGVLQLTRGMESLVKAAYTVLTMFQTRPEENFLQRFAVDMEKFNKSVTNSANSGAVRNIANEVRSFLSMKTDNFKSMWNSVMEFFNALFPVINSIAQAFSGPFVATMKEALLELGLVANAIHSIGLDQLIGLIWGATAGWKAFSNIMVPIAAKLKLIYGAFLIMRDATAVIGGVENAVLSLAGKLEGIPIIGKKAADSLANVGGSVGSALSKVAGAIPIVSGIALAIGAVALVWNKATDETNNFNNAIRDNDARVKQFGVSLHQAFEDDGGLAGKTVMSSITKGVETMFDNLDNLAKNHPNVMSHIKDFFTNSQGFDIQGNFHIGDSDATNKMQEQSDNAKHAAEQLRQLQKDGADLTSVLAGSDESFNKYIDHLREIGKNDAANALQDFRKQVSQAQHDAEALGQSGEKLAQGFDKISQSAGNATEKLDGLRLILEGLGLLKTTTTEAIVQYNSAIDSLVQKSQEAIENGDGLDHVWDNQKNTLDLNSKSGQNLATVWDNVSNAFLNAVAHGGDVNELIGRVNSQMNDLAGVTGISADKLKNYFSTSLGVNPVVKIAVQLGDVKDPLTRQLGEIMIELQNVAQGGVFVPVKFNSEKDAEQFLADMKDKLGQRFANDFSAQNSNVTLRPGVQISPDDMQKLTKFLNDHGIKTDSTPAPPAVIAPNAAAPGTAPGAPAPPPAPGQAPAAAPPSAPASDQAAGQVAQSAVDIASNILTSGGNTAGQKFVEALAAGIGKADAADKAAEALANSLIDHFHQSPPKKGPLAAHGDAAAYAGRAFVAAYATGMKGQSVTAADAASAIGSAASGGVASGGGKGIENAGKMLGQVSDMINFMDHVVNAFRGGFEGLVSAVKFLADPMGKGTFFGQSKAGAFGYRADPQARQKYLTNLQQKAFQTAGSGQIDISQIDATGMPKIQGAGVLQRDAKPEDVKRAIAAAGQAAGASPKDIAAAIAISGVETGDSYNPTIVGKGKGGGGADAIGLFQQTLGMWGNMEELTNPNIAIQKYWDAWGKNQGQGGDEIGRGIKTQAPGDPDYRKKVEQRMGSATKDLEGLMKSGLSPTSSGLTVPGVGGIPGLNGVTPILHDTDGKHTQPGVANVATVLASLFPQLTDIGGARIDQDKKEWHPAGRGLDVMIPGGDTAGGKNPQGKAYGDQIADFLRLNAKVLGINGFIWQNKYFPGNAPGQPQGPDVPGHFNHVHIQWNDGATIDIGPNGQNLKIPSGNPFALSGQAFGAPNVPGTPGYRQQGQQNKFMIDPSTGQLMPVSDTLKGGPIPEDLAPKSKLTDQGLEVYDSSGNLLKTFPRNIDKPQEVKDAAGRTIGIIKPGEKPNEPATLAPAENWNPMTGQPYTDAERQQFIKDHPVQYTPGADTTPKELRDMMDPNSGVFFGDQKSLEEAMVGASPSIGEAINKAYNGTPQEANQALRYLSNVAQSYQDQDTPEHPNPQAGAMASIISGHVSAAAGAQGLSQAPDPIDALGSAAGSISGAVQSIFSTINSAIESVGATKDIADTLVRGVQNTEDVNKMIDDFQKYIELAANIAGTVANVSGAIGSIVGSTGDASFGAGAAIQGVSAVASGIQAALQTTNAIIDLAQEAYHIWGSYYGQFQGMLAGGPEGELMGNVKYLIDQNTNQLLAYSADNPADKRAHDLDMSGSRPDQRNQLAGNIIVYGGPGSDPRDDTRQMLFQVRQATMGQAVVNG